MIPETKRYRLKNKLLGPPLVTEQLSSERLGRPSALGVLAPDCISSSAYGTEEMLTQLVPYVGLAAFSLVVPITLAILGVLFFVTLSYLDVIALYTKAGGSYVVARDNFGPKIAQIAAVALLIDYTVTVAVQTSAGTAALSSAIPALAHTAPTVGITVGVVLLLLYGNLRGIREAGKFFAFPTYFFIFSLGSVVITGFVREVLGQIHHIPLPPTNELYDGRIRPLGQRMVDGTGLHLVAALLRQRGLVAHRPRSHLERCVQLPPARGQARPPDAGHHELGPGLPGARRHHAGPVDPRGALRHRLPDRGVPRGQGRVRRRPLRALAVPAGAAGHGARPLYRRQHQLQRLPVPSQLRGRRPLPAAAADQARAPPGLLQRDPRAHRRGHRARFWSPRRRWTGWSRSMPSGVFTGFTMAGAGMVKHHLTHKGRALAAQRGHQRLLGLPVPQRRADLRGGEVQGGRLGRRRRRPAAVPRRSSACIASTSARPSCSRRARSQASEAPILRRHVVVVLVDRLDMATARALQYARTLTPDDLRAVHFDIDSKEARELEEEWGRLGLARLPARHHRVPRPPPGPGRHRTGGRRHARRRHRVHRAPAPPWLSPGCGSASCTTARRTRSPPSSARCPMSSATIIPYNLPGRFGERVRSLRPVGAASPPAQHDRPKGDAAGADRARVDAEGRTGVDRPAAARTDRAGLSACPRPTTRWPGGPAPPRPSRSIQARQRVRVAGRVKSVRVQPRAGTSNLECVLSDGTGGLLLVFQGRPKIAGIEPGARLVAEGMVGAWGRRPAMLNPSFELVRAPRGTRPRA